ncbi:ABC transporter permease [Hydrogenimonas sp.]
MLKDFYAFVIHLAENRRLLFSLARHDFREQYLGSYLGIFWAVARPTLFVLIMWAVFEHGFKAPPVVSDVPFALWLLCGFVPWTFFVEAVSKSTNAVVNNAFLVRKVAFRVSILPLVKILSALFVHLFLVFLILSVFVLYGYYPTLYWLQIPYFVLCSVVLVLGIGWLTSSLRVFVKDVGEVVAILLQFGFWVTPIFWSLHALPEKYRSILKFNPVSYIVEGFRDSLIHRVWFWEKPYDTAVFLVTTTFFLLVGAVIFKRLRPHFGDVL